jgi:hypothetical protein
MGVSGAKALWVHQFLPSLAAPACLLRSKFCASSSDVSSETMPVREKQTAKLMHSKSFA